MAGSLAHDPNTDAGQPRGRRRTGGRPLLELAVGVGLNSVSLLRLTHLSACEHYAPLWIADSLRER